KFIDLFQLASLIKNSFFVVANDTGPAHMAAHLGVRGVVLFGSHTSPDKVSIEREKFIALQVDDLKSLTADKVFGLIKSSIMN
ncbi:MAG: glycosyltransferase family 9 protein, partial [Candidatus Fonsibacter sp.]